VGVGWGVEVEVGGNGVEVIVGVTVNVAVAVGVIGTTTSGLLRKAKKTMMAPIARKIANKPMAAGRLRVISGIRLPWMALAVFLGIPVVLRSAPHTRQRVASSLNRVPQVGHNLVGVVVVSGLISLRREIDRLNRQDLGGLGDYTILFWAYWSNCSRRVGTISAHAFAMIEIIGLSTASKNSSGVFFPLNIS